MNFRKIVLTLIIISPLWDLGGVFAHPMPNSMVVLNVHEKHISGEMMLPLAELQSAIGMGLNDNSEKLVERLGDSLRVYLLKHIRPRSFEGKFWVVKLGEMRVMESQDKLVGVYKELVISFEMSPPKNYDLRNFLFDYDVILHQVASHRAFIHVRQDWQQGIVREDTLTQQLGIIEWDVINNKLNPFQVSLQQGSNWQGFKNMVSLGISHIWEGLDHILFVLTLLLSPLTPDGGINKKPFGNWGGWILKIITAFTIGHSLTLLLGSVKWLNFPVQPIEVLIALTIFISAFHAFRPIYQKREMFIAGLFGLIHGLAFAETLTNLELSTKQLIFSILGFNIGIELMQIGIIAFIFPILILLSKTQYYTVFRRIGAILMMILALAWLIERIQGKANFITELIS